MTPGSSSSSASVDPEKAINSSGFAIDAARRFTRSLLKSAITGRTLLVRSRKSSPAIQPFALVRSAALSCRRRRPEPAHRKMNNYTERLTRLASAAGTAEARVVRAFFQKPRKKAEHLRWLKAQGFKEYSAIRPILDALTQLH